MILVSVIIPIYNVSAYLSRCMESVFAQTYRNIEIIAIDDGSTDDSLSILKQYKDSRLKIISKPNGGLSSARNEGLKYMKGDYVTFVDSDDWIDQNMIEIMVSKASKYSADIVSVDELVTNGMVNDNIGKGYDLVYYDKDCLSQLLSMKVKSYTWGKLYKRYIFDNQDCVFPEGLNYEDIATSYKFFLQCKTLVVIKKYLYFYYQRANSIVRTKRLIEVKSMLNHLNEMQSYNIDNPFWGYYKLKIFYGVYVYLNRLPRNVKSSKEYKSLLLSLNKTRKQIVLENPLLWYIKQKDFYKVFLVKTKLMFTKNLQNNPQT